MEARKAASLALKLIGIFVLLLKLNYLVTVPSTVLFAFSDSNMYGSESVSTAAMTTITAFLYFIICIFFIAKSDIIAGWFVEDEDDTPVITGLDGETLMKIAFTCIGLFLIVNAIPDIGDFIFTNYRTKNVYHLSNYNTDWGYLVRSLLKIFIGIQ